MKNEKPSFLEFLRARLSPEFFGIDTDQNKEDFERIIKHTKIAFAVVVLGILLFGSMEKLGYTKLKEWENGLTFLISTLMSLIALYLSGAIAISQREQSFLARNTIAARQHLSDNLGDQMRRICDSMIPFTDKMDSRFVFEVYISTLAFGFLDRRVESDGSQYRAMDHFYKMLHEFCTVAEDRSKNSLTSELAIYIWKPVPAKAISDALKKQMNVDPILTEKVARLGELFFRLSEADKLGIEKHRSKLIRVRVYFTEPDELRFFMLGDGDSTSLKIQLLLMTPVKPGQDGLPPTLDSILLSDQTLGGSKRLKEYAERFIKNHCSSSDVVLAEECGSKLLADPKTELWTLLGVDGPPTTISPPA